MTEEQIAFLVENTSLTREEAASMTRQEAMFVLANEGDPSLAAQFPRGDDDGDTFTVPTEPSTSPLASEFGAAPVGGDTPVPGRPSGELPTPADLAAQRFTDQRGRSFDQIFGQYLPRRDEPYSEADAWNAFQSSDPGVIFSIKRRLIEAGLTTPSEINLYSGEWDDAEAAIVRPLISEANNLNTTLNAVIDLRAQAAQNNQMFQSLQEFMEERRAAREEATASLPDSGPSFQAPPYVAPDYSTLAQTVKSTMRDSLGRDPEEWEIDLLADSLRESHREAYDAQVRRARATFGGGDFSGRVIEGAEVEVDPAARFAEKFEELYGPELERRERVQATSEGIGRLMRSVTGMDNLIRGGG